MIEGAIHVEKLGKRYRIGGLQQRHNTLRDGVVHVAGRAVSRLRRQSTLAPEETIWALRDVGLDVQPGEVVGIIGRNGAGKSTLLKILSRITEPTEGRAVVNGRVASLLEVGTGFHGELTGRENVYLNGAILGMRKAEIDRKFDEIVEFSGVERFIDTPVKRYSSGMQVRLAFAVAAHLEPEILLVDEVLAVGDVSFQKKSATKMREVSRTGRTVLFVSHNMLQIRTMCSRCVLLESGVLSADGEPADVISRYLAIERSGLLSRRIEQRDHAFGVGKVRVEDIAILGDSGEVLREVLYHQPLRIRVHVNVLAPVAAGKFSLAVLSIEDARIWMTHSRDSDEEYDELPRGRYDVEIRLANGLKPGHYKIEFGGHQLPSTLSLCHVPDALRFTVAEQGYTPEDRTLFCNRASLVDATSSWTMEREAC